MSHGKRSGETNLTGRALRRLTACSPRRDSFPLQGADDSRAPVPRAALPVLLLATVTEDSVRELLLNSEPHLGIVHVRAPHLPKVRRSPHVTAPLGQQRLEDPRGDQRRVR